MQEQWVVLVEAVANGSRPIGPAEVSQLLAALAPSAAGRALHCPERYALQLTMTAPSPDEALIKVFSWWTDVLERLGLPPRRVVRTEVLSRDELERDLEQAHSTGSLRWSPEGLRGP